MFSKDPPPKKKGVDLIARGRYGSNLLGSATFIALTTGPLSALPTHALFRLFLPLRRWIILSLSAAAAVKQIFWLLYTSKEELSPASVVTVGVFNAVSNDIDSAFFVAAATPGYCGVSTKA
ncbi:hypothetical protein QBC43DRAFT_293596 [Cladorrhinum sp. PSN259]|nr:hypothetical protein QBC43DRAFT_293596 [Cladorrhinum sp. PSN259]